MHEPERIIRIVSEVCSQGVGLHLDDFGTGYSSLSALAEFPVHALKIDRGFINPLTGDGDINQAIVRSTIALGTRSASRSSPRVWRRPGSSPNSAGSAANADRATSTRGRRMRPPLRRSYVIGIRTRPNTRPRGASTVS